MKLLEIFKSENNIKEHGKLRQEGKNYIVKDGDIIFFKFNVSHIEKIKDKFS